ncbi:MAG: helix-turn-helix transcriptional regulator [Deltaproteobacteria bacterium]|jgi:transcriptional regulator with XRE-family HTH domain|nr:helix-turn-helix transcriptional regulator [Deltaproteobacteria bacterium]
MELTQAGLFPALLRHWRRQRGRSQLDLGLDAGVSARHLSFLETGRATPSREMVLRLGHALAVPLRDQNALLSAAGFGREFPEAQGPFTPAIEQALTRMLAQQEPYPLTVLNPRYDVVRANQAALRILPRFVLDPLALGGDAPLNALRMVFDPRLARPFILDWPSVARDLAGRVHREILANPGDRALRELVASVFDAPDVPPELREPDLGAPSTPVLAIRLRRDDLELGFFTTITTFNAPQNVTLEELRIESYFPLDDETARVCAALASVGVEDVS